LTTTEQTGHVCTIGFGVGVRQYFGFDRIDAPIFYNQEGGGVDLVLMIFTQF